MRWWLALASILLVVGCGSDEPAPSGWQGNKADAGAFDGFSWDGAYPTADPDPDAAPIGGPTFGGDGGSPPGAFTCNGKSAGSGDRTLTLTSGGLLRIAYAHVPAGYDPAKGTMVVLNFHGFTNAAPIQRVISRMDPSSDTHGYIAVYPEGVATSWNAGDCCGTAWTDSVDDVKFVKELLAKLESDYCIDPKRVFATGYSNGGFLSYRLACDMADTFAAIAPVAGEMGMAPEQCHPTRPVPVLDFHGTSDPIVPYNGGTPLIPIDLGPILKFRGTSETLQIWTAKDGCLGGPKTIYQKGDATCQAWGACNADVVHCKIDQGGHTWPGGVPVPLVGKTSTDIGATETMYEFFAAHPMP